MILMREIDGRRAACWVSSEEVRPGRRTLVFVHGAGGDHTLWQPQCAALSGEFQIAAVDLPGHGESQGPGEQEASRYGEWLKKLLAAIGIARPVLVGHSLGAAVCLSFALHNGDAAAAVVSVGGGPRMPVNPTFLKELGEHPADVITRIAAISVAKANRERLAGPAAEGLTRCDPEVLTGDFLACDRLDLRESLAQIRIPTLIVCGAEDKMAPPGLSAALKDGVAGARLAVIEGAGHFVMRENAEAFNAALTAFVRSLPETA